METKNMRKTDRKAFTLVELLILVVIMAIAAVVAIPMIGSASTMQLKAAANKIAADLEYAKSMAISMQKNYTIAFNTLNERYFISNEDNVLVPIEDPLRRGKNFLVEFQKDSRVNQVDIDTVSFDSVMAITFDYLGCPYAGTSTNNALVDGSNGVTLKAGNDQMKVLVEPVTGYVSIE